MENIKKGRVLRDTLYGRVRIGTAVLKSAASAAASSAAAAGAGAGAAATPAASPGSAASPPPQQQELVVVIKEYEKSLVERRVTRSGQPVHEDAKSELRLHASLCREPSSPHIVRLFDLRADATHYYAVLEFCSRGEFFAFVSHPNFTREHARHFFRQLIVGVDFMHKRGVAHRDLSLENILLDEQHVLKICDFGVACESRLGDLVHEDHGPVGKLKYMAPEVFARHAYDPRKADVWSCGVILFIMLVFPFDRPTLDDDRFVHCCSERINPMLAAWGKPLLEPATRDLFAHIFCPSEFRYDAAQILQHPYCTGADLSLVPTAIPPQPQPQPQQSGATPPTAHSSSSQPGASQFVGGAEQQQQQQRQQAAVADAHYAAGSSSAAEPSAMNTALSPSSSTTPAAAAAAAAAAAQLQHFQQQQQQQQLQQQQQPGAHPQPSLSAQFAQASISQQQQQQPGS